MSAFDHWEESLAAQADDDDAPTRRELNFEEAAVNAERTKEWWADIPEPPELVAQTAALAAQRAHNEIRCADCDRPRWAHGWKASELTQACRFVEPCPNANDPVLCAYDNAWQRFIPEAGCPVHDPEVRS